MIFSPLAMGLMLLTDKPSMRWFDGIELVHLLLGALGILLLSVRLRWSPLAGLLAAMVYMFGGSAAARLQHVPVIFAYGYFPFALLTLDLALETGRIRWGVYFGLLAGIMAAHQVQVSYLFGLTLVGYCLHRIVSAESMRGFLATRWRVLATAAGTGSLVLAISLYLTLQFLPLSNRPRISYESAVVGSQHPLTFLTLFVRNVFGNSNRAFYWGPGDVTETYLYVGILPLALIVAYGIPSGLLFARQLRYFLSAGVLAGLFAAGNFTPFYWLVYHVLPGVNLYRRTPDANFVVNMVLALACGFLMDRLLSGTPVKLKYSILAVELGVLAVLFGWGVRYAEQHGQLARAVKDFWLTALYMTIAFALLHTMVRRSPGPVRFRLGVVFVALVALDLGVYNAGSRLNATNPRFVALLEVAPEGRNPLVNFLLHRLDLGHQTGGPFRAEITSAGPVWAAIPQLVGIPSTQGYNPIRLRLYEQVAGAQESGGVPRPFTPMMPAYGGPMLNLLGIKYIVSTENPSELSSGGDVARLSFVMNQGSIKVWANSAVLPHALIATSIYLEPELQRAVSEGNIEVDPISWTKNRPFLDGAAG